MLRTFSMLLLAASSAMAFTVTPKVSTSSTSRRVFLSKGDGEKTRKALEPLKSMVERQAVLKKRRWFELERLLEHIPEMNVSTDLDKMVSPVECMATRRTFWGAFVFIVLIGCVNEISGYGCQNCIRVPKSFDKRGARDKGLQILDPIWLLQHFDPSLLLRVLR
jgi:hypothetical protein